MEQTKIHRIKPGKTGLLIVDIQERLLPAMFEKERVLQNSIRLASGAGLFQMPTLVTEQYRKGLGATCPELAQVIPGFAPVEKLAFSACGVPQVAEFFPARGISHVVVCGIEAHVCVCQTCLDLLENGITPFVVADAVSSRTAQNMNIGLERMRDAGAVIVSTEMVLFELLERAGTDAFKQVLNLVK